MAHLIDKDALVAEIEKLVDKGKYHEEYDCAHRDGNNSALYALKGKINTLEAKEVDLEEELESFAYTLPHSAIGDVEHLGKFDDPRVKEARKHGWSHSWRYNYVKEIAKHFFELGIGVGNKAQKDE